ncbi:MAG: DEAD/DEAH box helicase, partial [Gammaproteobacteria bacterium]|nr:DEAD/DEAH box helicase [Gammaproteobacteria bacterium]
KQRAVALHHCRHQPVILLINYEQSKETYFWFKPLAKDGGKFHVIVADESSWIKNGTAKRTKATIALRSFAEKAYALSGTPILQGPMDLHSQMAFVDPSILPENIWAFRARYAIIINKTIGRPPGTFGPDDPGTEKTFKVIDGYQNMDELMERLRPWSMSLLKKDVAPELPPKIYETREVELDAKERKNFQFIEKEMALVFPEGGFVPLPNALSKLMKLMQGSSGFYYYDIPVPGSVPFDGKHVVEHGSTKRKEVIEMLDHELAGKPIILWSALKWEQWRLAEELKEAGHTVACKYFDKTAARAAEQFIDGKADILVASAAELGYGLNAQRSSDQIFVSNNFKFGDRRQGEDRQHRIGQENPVTIVDMIAIKTRDEKVLGILQGKGDISDFVMKELGVNVRK